MAASALRLVLRDLLEPCSPPVDTTRLLSRVLSCNLSPLTPPGLWGDRAGGQVTARAELFAHTLVPSCPGTADGAQRAGTWHGDRSWGGRPGYGQQTDGLHLAAAGGVPGRADDTSTRRHNGNCVWGCSWHRCLAERWCRTCWDAHTGVTGVRWDASAGARLNPSACVGGWREGPCVQDGLEGAAPAGRAPQGRSWGLS